MLKLLVVISCIFGFCLTQDLNTEKCINKQSTDSYKPGLKIMPMPDDGSTLIWLKALPKTNYEYWKTILLKDLDKYYNPKNKENVTKTSCSYDKKPTKGQVCDVDVLNWGPCNPENYFNYHRKAPCVFLKLNGLHDGWEPEYYNNPDDLPIDMPKQLVDHIRFNIKDPLMRNNVWVTCAGEYPADLEYMGPVKYYPSMHGFPGYYFPHQSSDDYLSPILAVQFQRPAAGIVMNIECRAWAKNIHTSRSVISGKVHFELLVD